MKIGRLHIGIFLGLATVIWFLSLLVVGTPATLNHLAPFGTVVTSLVIAQLVLEHWLWSKPWLHGWFIQRPDLRGTWRVYLQSDWVDPATNKKNEPALCFAAIEQSLSKLQLHLMTSESESWIVADSVLRSPSERGYQIVAVYTNKPRIHLRTKTSNIHLGAMIMDTHGNNEAFPDSLTAEYWTDRSTTGTMEFSERLGTVYSRYADAKAAYQEDISKPKN